MFISDLKKKKKKTSLRTVSFGIANINFSNTIFNYFHFDTLNDFGKNEELVNFLLHKFIVVRIHC